MKVVPLHPRLACEEIVNALRNIADDIEAGSYDFDPNLAVLVLAQESQRRDGGGFVVSYNWQTHGIGEKATIFTTRGILASAVARFDGDGA